MARTADDYDGGEWLRRLIEKQSVAALLCLEKFCLEDLFV
jgi:hypothetical protein